MINLILKFHELCYGSNERHAYKRHKQYLLWVLSNVGARLAQQLLQFYLWCYKLADRYPKPLNDGGAEIIVSLTSFPARINTAWMAIDSIMRQKIRPSKVLLYLSDEEFPLQRGNLPRRLLNYEKIGLQICFRPHNLMPHKKYFYALQEHPGNDVITIDDDIYYHTDMIGNLVRTHSKHPNCVCSNVVRVIRFGTKGTPMPYKDWERLAKPVSPSLKSVALGYAGVFYPAGIFKTTTVFDMDNIRKLALRVDDLWLRIHETTNKIKVANGEYICIGVEVKGTQRISLHSDNFTSKLDNGNDTGWRKLCSYYRLCMKDFQDEW